jgi:hypothetical protein
MKINMNIDMDMGIAIGKGTGTVSDTGPATDMNMDRDTRRSHGHQHSANACTVVTFNFSVFCYHCWLIFLLSFLSLSFFFLRKWHAQRFSVIYFNNVYYLCHSRFINRCAVHTMQIQHVVYIHTCTWTSKPMKIGAGPSCHFIFSFGPQGCS